MYFNFEKRIQESLHQKIKFSKRTLALPSGICKLNFLAICAVVLYKKRAATALMAIHTN